MTDRVNLRLCEVLRRLRKEGFTFRYAVKLNDEFHSDESGFLERLVFRDASHRFKYVVIIDRRIVVSMEDRNEHIADHLEQAERELPAKWAELN